jgi:hypothetical protein
MNVKTIGISKAPQWFGCYDAIVYNITDPEVSGRIQMQIPQVMGNAISNWAPQLSGTSTPDEGTYVVAMFLGGDINKPVFFMPLT